MPEIPKVIQQVFRHVRRVSDVVQKYKGQFPPAPSPNPQCEVQSPDIDLRIADSLVQKHLDRFLRGGLRISILDEDVEHNYVELRHATFTTDLEQNALMIEVDDAVAQLAFLRGLAEVSPAIRHFRLECHLRVLREEKRWIVALDAYPRSIKVARMPEWGAALLVGLLREATKNPVARYDLTDLVTVDQTIDLLGQGRTLLVRMEEAALLVRSDGVHFVATLS